VTAESPAGRPTGVLVMAYGGPASLDEIPGYLADIRSGRPTPRRVLEEIARAFPWSEADARAWWAAHGAALGVPAAP